MVAKRETPQVALSIMKAFLDEIHDSPAPASAAIFVIGLMAGEIAKQTGSDEFMGLMRMIVSLHEQEQEGKQDQAEIAQLMALLEIRYLRKVAIQ